MQDEELILTDEDKAMFKELVDSILNDSACIITTRKRTGERVLMLARVEQGAHGKVDVMPMGELIPSDKMIDLYLPPCGAEIKGSGREH